MAARASRRISRSTRMATFRRSTTTASDLWESMAINLYLAKKYGSGSRGLYPQRLEDEARAWQWSFWGMTEIERPALTALLNRIGPERRARCGRRRRGRARARRPAPRARRGRRRAAVPARRAFHRCRSERRQHSFLGAPGAGRSCRRFPRRRHGSKLAMTDLPLKPPGSCSGNKRQRCGLVALLLTSVGSNTARWGGKDGGNAADAARNAGSWAGRRFGPETLYQGQNSHGR